MSADRPWIGSGFHSANPYLIVHDAEKAMAFYAKGLGAEEVMRLRDPDGAIAHAEVRIGDTIIMLAPEREVWGNRSPRSLGGSPVVIHLYVPDADALIKRAEGAGAKVLAPPADQFYGDRSGRIEDPFGHIWLISTHKEELSPAEAQRRYEAHLKK